MNRSKLLVLVLFSAIVATVASIAHAATPTVVSVPIGACLTIQRNGATQFKAQDIDFNGNTWNFSGDCGAEPPPDWTPPPGLLTRANVSYNTNPAVDRNADLTTWEKLWGRVAYNEAGWPWPASSGARPHYFLGRSQYTCTKFVPLATLPTSLSLLSMSSYQTVGNVDATISPRCGDFREWADRASAAHGGYAIGGSACVKSGVGAFASQFMTYKSGPSTSGFCGLDYGVPYYLNVRFKDSTPIPATGPLCNTLGCQVGIQSNPAAR